MPESQIMSGINIIDEAYVYLPKEEFDIHADMMR